jgi:hypothetical protein
MEINEKNYFELKNIGKKRAEIADTFNIPEWKLKKLISANKWATAKPTVSNSDVFSEVTELSAYWAGFIAADGCITNDTVKICLNYDDLCHLEKFKNFVGSTHKISTNTDKYYRCEISFKNPTIINDLKNIYNITERKSLTYELPDIPENYFSHYLRGYFDGDGCICESFSNKNSKTATLYTTITGSNNFIADLYKAIKLDGTIQKKQHVSVIKYNTNSSKILLDYMYSDASIYLDRKYSLYLNISKKRKTR